jgi:hypothetical protein
VGHVLDKKEINGESAASGRPRLPGSAGAQTFLVLCCFAILSLDQSSWRWALVRVAGMDYLIVAIMAGVVFFTWVGLRKGFRFSAKASVGRLALLFVTLALCFVATAGGIAAVLLAANAFFDPGPNREFTTLVASEPCGGASSGITVRGAPGAAALPMAVGTMRVTLRRGTCRSARDGDTVLVVIGPGYFRRPWIQDARLVQVARQ